MFGALTGKPMSSSPRRRVSTNHTGSAIVDHVGRRKLLLTGIGCAAVGMCIVGSLLSPTGEQSKTRADAGISFICT